MSGKTIRQHVILFGMQFTGLGIGLHINYVCKLRSWC